MVDYPRIADQDEQPLGCIGALRREGRMLDTEDMCAILNVSNKTIYSMADRGKIPHFRVGNLLRFDPFDIIKWLNDHRFGIQNKQKFDRRGAKNNAQLTPKTD